MINAKGVERILSRIFETGGLTEDMEEDIKRLKDEFDEREGMLRKYGEWDEEGDEDGRFEYKEFDREAWREKYDELKKKYIKRFFGDTTVDEYIEKESDKNDDELEKSIEDLFIEKEK